MGRKFATIIYSNSVVRVEPPDLELSVGNQDEVTWSMADSSHEFDIDFGSPQNCPFDMPNGKGKSSDHKCNSGSIRKPQPNVSYSYTVIIRGGAAADPQIIIRP